MRMASGKEQLDESWLTSTGPLLPPPLQGGGGGGAAPAAPRSGPHAHHRTAAARHRCSLGRVSGCADGVGWAAAVRTVLLPRRALPWHAGGGLTAAAAFLARRCRTATGAAPLPGKRKLLPVSSTFRLPGDAVPAHMMFGPASKAARLSDRPTSSNMTSGNRL